MQRLQLQDVILSLLQRPLWLLLVFQPLDMFPYSKTFQNADSDYAYFEVNCKLLLWSLYQFKLRLVGRIVRLMEVTKPMLNDHFYFCFDNVMQKNFFMILFCINGHMIMTTTIMQKLSHLLHKFGKFVSIVFSKKTQTYTYCPIVI